MDETEVEVEDYEEVIGDLYYDASVEAGPNSQINDKCGLIQRTHTKPKR